jgi:transcriptional regulator GlxA family with amidase domain
MTTVLFVVVPGVHLLDLAGPAQVFSEAADSGLDYRLAYVSEHELVPSAQGLPVAGGLTWPELDPDDIVVVPGWRARRLAGSAVLSPGTIGRLRAHHDRGGIVASVCAGADALGRAGLLDGRRCTTHHDLQDELARRYPRAHVVRDVLFTQDGRVVTSAGIASGIDLALHLVASRHGAGRAARIARGMVVYARRNGDAPQISALLRHRAHLNDSVHRVQDLIDTRFDDRLLLSELAAAAGVSERTLTRQFGRSLGMTPLRYQQLLRLEQAEHLIEQGSTVDAAARTVGFEDARMLRRLRARETR